MDVATVIRYVEGLSGHPLNRDEGVHHGAPGRSVSGVTVCWMASPTAIVAAGSRADELLICHESLYYPYDVVVSADPPPGWQAWPTNRQRRAALERYDLTCLRLHGSLDEICIFDDFASLLGLSNPVYTSGMVKVYEIEECSLADLIERVKASMHMPYLRVSTAGGLEQRVRRVGLPWGGLGLFVNVGYQQQLIVQGCDVLIAGESDNYGFRFSKECGIPMIETSHELSENPGLRHFSEMLARAFPTLQTHFFEDACAWQIL